jgi:hypothetical protein
MACFHPRGRDASQQAYSSSSVMRSRSSLGVDLGHDFVGPARHLVDAEAVETRAKLLGLLDRRVRTLDEGATNDDAKLCSLVLYAVELVGVLAHRLHDPLGIGAPLSVILLTGYEGRPDV